MRAVEAAGSLVAAKTSGGVVITAELTSLCTEVAAGDDALEALGPRPEGVVAADVDPALATVLAAVGVGLGEGSVEHPNIIKGAAKATMRSRRRAR